MGGERSAAPLRSCAVRNDPTLHRRCPPKRPSSPHRTLLFIAASPTLPPCSSSSLKLLSPPNPKQPKTPPSFLKLSFLLLSLFGQLKVLFRPLTTSFIKVRHRSTAPRPGSIIVVRHHRATILVVVLRVSSESCFSSRFEATAYTAVVHQAVAHTVLCPPSASDLRQGDFHSARVRLLPSVLGIGPALPE
ncbi:hypothetical protein PIB30_090630 [Stylosanthes scabra]|uniref:Uncharacterized protein n=1 Tax=Stylosanthes scabra TaxID=79078 RepID=A0ABU6ZTL0_9FABA|nr:hypothetical protein [Stylosanthes scabra]